MADLKSIIKQQSKLYGYIFTFNKDNTPTSENNKEDEEDVKETENIEVKEDVKNNESKESKKNNDNNKNPNFLLSNLYKILKRGQWDPRNNIPTPFYFTSPANKYSVSAKEHIIINNFIQ